MAYLVADLHPAHLNPFCLHPLQDIDGKQIQPLAQLRQCQSLPGMGHKLLLRIRPPVAVVKIEHDAQTRGLRAPRQRHHLLRTIEALRPGLVGGEMIRVPRIVPHLDAHRIEAFGFEQAQAIHGLPVTAQHAAVILQLRQRRDVGAANEITHCAASAKVLSPGSARPWKSNSVTLSHSSPAPAFQPAPGCGIKSGSQ